MVGWFCLDTGVVHGLVSFLSPSSTIFVFFLLNFFIGLNMLRTQKHKKDLSTTAKNSV